MGDDDRRSLPGERHQGLGGDDVAGAKERGVSRDTFDRHICHELRIVRRGRCLIVPVAEMERWLEREAARWSA